MLTFSSDGTESYKSIDITLHLWTMNDIVKEEWPDITTELIKNQLLKLTRFCSMYCFQVWMLLSFDCTLILHFIGTDGSVPIRGLKKYFMKYRDIRKTCDIGILGT